MNLKRKEFTGRLFSISSSERTHYFYLSRGDKNTYEAFRNTQNKKTAKKLLAAAGITVPEGKQFDEKNSNDEIIRYAENLGYPVVLKPTNKGMGEGVFVDIKNEKELKKALSLVREQLNFKKVLLEKYYRGEDYRVYVVQNRVIGIINRVSANITGDGKNTIETLIKNKNKSKKIILIFRRNQ